ncbi:MAG: hypothetical protein ACR2PA_26605 [Hyphomicrobiaceae bacterium]
MGARFLSRIALSLIIGCFVLVSTTAPQARRHKPFKIERLVNQITSFQDQLVSGNRRALKKYREALADVSRKIASAPVSVWEREQNRTAGIKYLLAGGHAAIGQRMMEGYKFEGNEAQLLQGAIAFADGDRAVALKLLKPIDALVAPPSLAGNLALIQGILSIRKTPKQAAQYLKSVLILAPFSLQAEAALRRLVRIPLISGSWDELNRLGARYLQRYPQSLFADSFRKPFAQALAVFKDYDTKQDRRERLLELLRRVDDQHRRAYVYAIARAGLVVGNIALANTALEADSQGASADKERDMALQLYKAITLLLAGKLEPAARRLQGVNPAVLRADDVRLLRTANMLDRAIRKRPAFSEPTDQLRKLAAAARDGHEFTPMTLAQSARSMIASTDKLLEK